MKITTIKKVASAVLLATCLQQQVWAANFTVRKIEVSGLQRIPYSTVLNYVPIKVGQDLTDQRSNEVVRELYKTGFFQYVELKRSGETLIIQVVERATIAGIDLTGTHDIPHDKLMAMLKEMGVAKGQVFRRAAIDQFKESLVEEYNNRGKYNASVTVNVVPTTQNRVKLNIIVSEGRVARIRDIHIIGNKAFSDWRLKHQLSLGKTTLLSYLTSSDQYSEMKLQSSLEALRSFYLNNGYVKFRIESYQVSISPDRKSVYLTIRVTEGPQYHYSGYDLSGKLILTRAELHKYVAVRKGDVFSREAVTQTVERIGQVLANRGYGFPNVTAEPQIDEKNKTVFVTFLVEPGRHIYVRRINFRGNTKTGEYVLRRVIRQPEGGMLRLNKVKESERQLRVVGYLKDVQVKTEKVPGTNNQVDLNFEVKEAPSAELMAQISVSQVKFRKDDGSTGSKLNPSLNIAFNQHNFMGTGRTVGINFTNSLWGQTYSLSQYNPFITDRIGGGFEAYYQRSTPEKLRISSFSTNKYGGNYHWNFILSDHASIQSGVGYQHLQLRNVLSAPTQLQAFAAAQGQRFSQVRLTAGASYNTYDRMPYPTRGVNLQIAGLVALPADSTSLSYYTASAMAHAYYPLVKGFIFSLYGTVAYGNQFNGNGLPFFENFFAGGNVMPAQVRGFDNYSLGPTDSRGNPLGGNFLAAGSAALILPKPLSQGPFRTSLFIDAGNVWSRSLPLAQQGAGSGPMRFSGGVAVDWRSPFGPLTISMGWPFKTFRNPQTGIRDRVTVPQFTMSSSF